MARMVAVVRNVVILPSFADISVNFGSDVETATFLDVSATFG